MKQLSEDGLFQTPNQFVEKKEEKNKNLYSSKLLRQIWQGIPTHLQIPKDCITLSEILHTGKQSTIHRGFMNDRIAIIKTFEGILNAKRISKEISFMQRAQGAGVAKLFGVSCLDDSTLCLVMEYGETLDKFIKQQSNKLSEAQILKLCLKLIPVIIQVHSKDIIIFCDLNPTNIFYDEKKNVISIANFSKARDSKEKNKSKSFPLNDQYPPEFCNGEIYPATDIYYIGKILEHFKYYNPSLFLPASYLDVLRHYCLSPKWEERPWLSGIYKFLIYKKELMEKTSQVDDCDSWTQKKLNEQLKNSGFTEIVLHILFFRCDIRPLIEMMKSDAPKKEEDSEKLIDERLYIFFLQFLHHIAKGIFGQYKTKKIKFVDYSDTQVQIHVYQLVFSIAYDVLNLQPEKFYSPYFPYKKIRNFFEEIFFQHFRAEEFFYWLFQINCTKSYPAITPPTEAQLKDFNLYWPIFQKTAKDLMDKHYIQPWEGPSNVTTLSKIITKGLMSSFSWAMSLNIQLDMGEIVLLLEKVLKQKPTPETPWLTEWAALALLKSAQQNLGLILIQAAENFSPEILNILSKLSTAGINVNDPIGPGMLTPVEWLTAIYKTPQEHPKIERLIDGLLLLGLSLNAVIPNKNRTILQHVMITGQKGWPELLIEKKANVNNIMELYEDKLVFPISSDYVHSSDDLKEAITTKTEAEAETEAEEVDGFLDYDDTNAQKNSGDGSTHSDDELNPPKAATDQLNTDMFSLAGLDVLNESDDPFAMGPRLFSTSPSTSSSSSGNKSSDSSSSLSSSQTSLGR